MTGILDYIAEETGGRTYRSHRFCFDAEFRMPTIEYDDNQDFTLHRSKYGETDTSLVTTKDLSRYSRGVQLGTPLFRYFLDGSRRVYKIDDIEYNRRIFPAIGGQIGVACCERQSKDVFRTVKFQRRRVLSLPRIATSGHPTQQFLGRLVQKVNESDRLKRFGLTFDEILVYSADLNASGKKEEYMDRGTATVQDRMVESEKEVVDALVKEQRIDEDNYLIKDGSLQYSKTTTGDFRDLANYRRNYRHVVGVSKSFNPESSKNRRGQSNASDIAKLRLYHRTPAARYQFNRIGNVDFAVWFVRIRESKYSGNPFAGILKLEKVLVTPEEINDGLETSEVDRITANLINERNPVCYGTDQRWANHLYPVYLTEALIKSKYLSDMHFINLF